MDLCMRSRYFTDQQCGMYLEDRKCNRLQNVCLLPRKLAAYMSSSQLPPAFRTVARSSGSDCTRRVVFLSLASLLGGWLRYVRELFVARTV